MSEETAGKTGRTKPLIVVAPAVAGSASSWLFPEIEQEIRDDRSATARQAAQRVRNEKRKAIEYLRKRDLQWLIDKLVDDGPSTDCGLMFALIDRPLEDIGAVWVDLWSLWRVGKLWRKSQGIHFGSGEEFFLYGIRGVHPQNDALCESAGRKKTHESIGDVAAPSDSQQQMAMPPSVGNAHNNTKSK